KLQVVATIFPLYDFARAVAGDRAEVRLLLPPGVEAHSFEPRPEDVLRLQKADIFLYTLPAMEPWGAHMLKSVEGGRLTVIEAGGGVPLRRPESRDAHGHGHEQEPGGGVDPHIWLDPQRAALMVENIARGFAARDPQGAEVYAKNAAEYRAKLAALDAEYRDGLRGCGSKVLLHGGHYAFGYLAERYGLRYLAAFPPGESEPTPREMASLVELMRQKGMRHVFYEELATPRTAQTLAREVGGETLLLHGAHNVSRQELEGGITYLQIMRNNLAALRTGLQCR
ncbi:MAG TPA: zinc ABC transporter substrate-binding protein, partial [Verrucomicrobiae bacterium]|nr:zinc ABC transporter substrate-binding protein [Verrucomicrobiae bacterium]